MNGAHLTTTLLRDARIVLPEQIAEHASLLISNGLIAELFQSPSNHSPSADKVIDLPGLTLFPGFIDLHIHGAVGVDTMEASAADLAESRSSWPRAV